MQRNPLAANFVVAKPIGQESYKRSTLLQLESMGGLIGTRKRDGHKVIVEVCPQNRIRIYRSGMQEIDNRLDYIREEVRIHRFPSGTILIGELVVERLVDGRISDDVGSVTSVLGGSRAHAQQVLSRGPLPILFIFNVLYPEPHAALSKSKRYDVTLNWLQKHLQHGHYVLPVEQVAGTLSAMEAQARDGGWEGLVLYDASYEMTWRQRSAVPRPKGCYKLKPENEDDFFVLPEGRRFNPDRSLHDVMLLQWDPTDSRRMIECGRLGAFNAETRAAITADGRKIWVMQVRFVRRFPKSGKLREPVFMRFRDDKPFDECDAPQVWPEATFWQ